MRSLASWALAAGRELALALQLAVLWAARVDPLDLRRPLLRAAEGTRTRTRLLLHRALALALPRLLRARLLHLLLLAPRMVLQQLRQRTLPPLLPLCLPVLLQHLHLHLQLPRPRWP